LLCPFSLLLIAGGVILATALTDAAYVMFTSAVVSRRRIPAASWSSVWYLLSSFAVISYTNNWIYVCFAALGSWTGAFGSMTFLQRPVRQSPIGSAPEYDENLDLRVTIAVKGRANL
jgi:hypothetical protein